MEHTDQVHDGPFTGDPGEIKKDSSKEENSAAKPSEKKEETILETTEVAKVTSGEEDNSAPLPPEESPEEPQSSAEAEPKQETKPDEEADPPKEQESPEAIKPAAKAKPAKKAESSKEKQPAEKDEPEGEEKPIGEEKPESQEEPAEKDEPEGEEKPIGEEKPESQEEPAVEDKPEGEEKPIAEVKTEDDAKTSKNAKSSKKTAIPEAAASKIEEFDYSTLTREDLVNRLEILLDSQSVQEIRSDVDHLKVNFYKKNKAEIEQKRKKFIGEGGDIEDFLVQPDALEEKIKKLFKQYRDQKTEHNKNLELEKQENLKRKYEIIEKIKELINSKESINKTFNEFRDLQRDWRFIGLVPQQNLKDLWDTYNHHVEKFYDYIKINKELRDLDLKKNMELKMQLCERAEELLLETSVVNAFNSLQKYHDRWREIGPVPLEVRTEMWERFKEATTKINRRHQQYFEDQKKIQKKNLEQKILLCEQAEEISNLVLETHKQWDDKSKELIKLQMVWKTIGFAPRKDNNKIYERFRQACDSFFNRKREFYTQNKEIQLNNLQLKSDLCVQAESLQNSTEWKKTTDDLINLQKRWKEIGPVPKRQSDVVWKRFRAACDQFFQKKSGHYQNIDQTYTQNLGEKKKLLKEVESMKLSDNVEENFKILNEYQRRWSTIGFVPFKEKEALQEQFRKAINVHFDNMDISDSSKNILKFRNKLDNMLQKPKADVKLGQERERYINRLQQLKNDMVLWENNIGFFAKSKNAESMIGEVQSKIDNAKETIKLLEQKIEMIDNMETDKR